LFTLLGPLPPITKLIRNQETTVRYIICASGALIIIFCLSRRRSWEGRGRRAKARHQKETERKRNKNKKKEEEDEGEEEDSLSTNDCEVFQCRPVGLAHSLFSLYRRIEVMRNRDPQQ
jgi:hypothetical protein